MFALTSKSFWFGAHGRVLLLCYSDWYLLLLAEKAFGDDGNLRQPKELSINKVGHGKLWSCCLLIFCGGLDIFSIWKLPTHFFIKTNLVMNGVLVYIVYLYVQHCMRLNQPLKNSPALRNFLVWCSPWVTRDQWSFSPCTFLRYSSFLLTIWSLFEMMSLWKLFGFLVEISRRLNL